MTDIDIDRLAQVLAKADAAFVPFATTATLEAEEVVEENIGIYPPQPPRDRAKSFNTYVRGKGKYPRSAFIRDPKQPGGYRTRRVNKGTIKFTSERMNTRFRKFVMPSGNVVLGTLKNEASYSGYVIGHEAGYPQQRDFHKATGWRSVEEAIAISMPKINEIANKVVKDFIRSLL